MQTDKERPYGRDYPILLGCCPWCGQAVETEYIFPEDDPQIVEEEGHSYHTSCYHRSLDRET